MHEACGATMAIARANSLYDHICSKRGNQLVIPLVDHVAALHAKSSALQLQYTFSKELSMHCAHP